MPELTPNPETEPHARDRELYQHPVPGAAGARLRDYLSILSLSGLIVLLDQATKALVRARLGFGEIWVPWDWLAPYARVVHWRNTGAAFGLLQDFGLLFTILAFVVALAILFYFPQVPRQDWSLRLAMILQLGGAVGNLIDRLRAGEVTDFISVGRFPVFNVADASISIGVVILLLGIWIKERERPEDGATGLRDERSPAEREAGRTTAPDPLAEDPLSE